MSAYVPPSNYYNGSTYNPNNFSSANGNYALINESNTFTQNQFCTAQINENASDTQLITKGYLNLTYPTLSANNAWTGQNTYNVSLPTSTVYPTQSTQLITKQYGDSSYPILTSLNSFTNTNTFTNSIVCSNYNALTNSDMRISNSSGYSVYINNGKTSGDVQINSSSPNSNVNLLSGNLNINVGNIIVQEGYINITNPPSTNDNSNKVPTTSWVLNQISSSTVGTILLQSSTSDTQSFSFRCDQLTGTYYTFVIYSEYPMTTTGSSNNASGGTISSCSGGIIGTGMCSKVTFTNNSGSKVTYCSGFQQNYSWSQTNHGYLPSLITTEGNSFSSFDCFFGYTSENDTTCPPTAGTYSGSYMNFILASPIATQYLYMKLLLVF